MKSINVSIILFLSIVCIISAALIGCSKQEIGEISIWVQSRPEGDYTLEQPIVAAIMEETGVSFNFELAPYEVDIAKEKFNLMVASGDLPDLIVFRKEEIDKTARQGVFAPLSELVEEHAPNLTRILNENPTILKDLKINDGEFYHFPLLSAVRTGQIFIIRQDWLDNLGLESPETLDDFYNVLKAFKEQDPNGNGLADEIPFTTRAREHGILPFMEAWGISGYLDHQEFFVEDGKVKFAYIDPRFKEAATFLNKLYSEGLIDPEYVTADKNLWTARLSGEISGMTWDWFPRVDFFNKAVANLNPDAEFVGILPPIGPTGIRMTYWQQNLVRKQGATAISATAENKEQIVKFMDSFYAEDGCAMFMNFGVEGMHYEMIDGYPTFKPEMMNNPDKSLMYHLFEDGRFDLAHKQDIRYEDQLAPQAVLDARDMYVPYIADPYPPLALTEEEQEIMNEKFTEIKTYKDEMVNKFIMGTVSLDDFDEFVAQLKDMGIDEVLEVQQTALDRYNSK